MKKVLQPSIIQKALTAVVLFAFTGLMPLNLIAQTAPSSLLYSNATGIAYKKTAQNSVCPSINNGGAIVTYSLQSPPSGVTINASTGQISWDATVGVGLYKLTVIATNSVGSINTNYTLNVMPNPDDYITPKYTSATTSNLTYTGALSTGNSADKVDVFYPVGDTNTHRPVFMFMHGGGFSTSNDKTQSYVVKFCTYMATCGYIAYAPNYNVGGGHTLAQNLKSCKDMDACLNSIRRKQINYPVSSVNYASDSNYLFVGGGSAGGHLSCNFVFADSSTNYGGFVPNLKNIIAEADGWGSSPTTDRLYDFTKLRSNEIPTFIVQGTSDATVSPQESYDLDAALTAVGANHSIWMIPGETHGCPNHIPAISDSIAKFNNRAWKRKYPITANAKCVLPVKLSYFGLTQKENVIATKWTTTAEENVNYFQLERSLNGKEFLPVYTTKSIGGKSSNEYHFNDDVSLLAGTVYYRLKSVDNNGSYAYSEIESIVVKPTNNIVTGVYPNPAKSEDVLNVNYIATKSGLINYQVLNTVGQKVNFGSVQVSEGNNKISLKLNNLKAGIYYLIVLNNNSIFQRISFIVR